MSRVVGMASRTAAGDEDDLWRLLVSKGHALGDAPPYSASGLSNPRCGVVQVPRDRAAEHLLLDVVQRALGELPRAGTGLIVGTASGNISGPWERWHTAHLAGERSDDSGTGRHSATDAVAEQLGLTGPVATLSVACVSGVAVMAVAEAWLATGRCERVVCAGVDALSNFVHAGFSALGALATELPHPFEERRDGLVLGEGAAAVVLTHGAGRGLRAVALSSDAVHLTAPDRTGAGMARALSAALAGARVGRVDAVGAHATATQFNDAMEVAALNRVFPGDSPPVHTVKQAIGHTCGAAGAVEAVVALQMLERGSLPVRLGRTDGPVRTVATLAAAFGGMNACAVFGDQQGVPKHLVDAVTRRRAVSTGEDLSRHWPSAPGVVLRADSYTRAVIGALFALFEQGVSRDSALVLTSMSNCRLWDERHHRRLLEGRPSPRAFAATIPALPLATASVVWGITAPLLSFVGTSDSVREAIALVRAGFYERAIAIHCEAPSADEPGWAVATEVVR